MVVGFRVRERVCDIPRECNSASRIRVDGGD